MPRKSILLLIVLILIAFGVLVYFDISIFQLESVEKKCITKIEEKVVRGSSLSPLIESDERVEVLFGFYDCNEVKLNDIVLYGHPGYEEPLIKIVKGISGDNFRLEENEEGWNILIDGNIVQNSEDIPYLINEKRANMLKLYEKDYKGIIPDNTFLLLGNVPSGSMDSTRFGLVDKVEFLGKVIR